ncbi:phosphoheptose isomerase [Candidatus Woesearchaeota archaeon CG10_big_fil_rev_8_21_14_0_10_44_13]|nr:MAG: phosphoheptose isomerase [Candidatus Woesearchaeota archaeon CG10_big_fil_rev_8_21_14_0_10_44_13]
MKEFILESLGNSIDVKKKIAETLTEEIILVVNKIIESCRKGGKLILFGNGGSASDAQHIATELIHQFELKGRRAIPAIALTTNTSLITAIGNDWGFDRIFERQVEGLVKKGDVVIGLTTSGNSTNVIKGLVQAKKNGAFTIAFTGRGGGAIKDIADISLIVPSDSTPRIQEAHITVGHIICHLIEREVA